MSDAVITLVVYALFQFLVSPIFVTCPTVVNLMKNWVFMHKVSLMFLREDDECTQHHIDLGIPGNLNSQTNKVVSEINHFH